MSHTLALTLPFNFSFAENRGTGTLGDGFIGLDSSCDDGCCPGSRSSAYVVDIRSVDVGPVTPVPEPPVWGLARHRRRGVVSPGPSPQGCGFLFRVLH